MFIRARVQKCHVVSQAKRDIQNLDASTATKKWKKIAYSGVEPIQKTYLAAVDSLEKLFSNGIECVELRDAVDEAVPVLRQLLALEKEAQDCYIDAQLGIIESTGRDSNPHIEEKKKLRFHFFCSHVCAEMAIHVSVTTLALEQRGCRVWTDTQESLDIDGFGMV